MPGDTDTARQVDSGAVRKRRTKTFTGCWTCKGKHLKCDEARPSCERCRRSSILCQGYGVRLSWTSVRNQSNFACNSHPVETTASVGRTTSSSPCRLSPNPEHFAGDPSTSGHAHEALVSPRHDDQYAPPTAVHGNTNLGPSQDNAVFESRRHSASYLHQGSTPAHIRSGTSTPGTHMTDDSVSEATRLNQDTNIPDSSIPGSSIPGSTGPGSSDRAEATYTDVTWLPQTDTTRGAASSCLMRVGARPSGLRHLDLLPDPGLQSEIIEHWTQSLCDSFNPVPGMNNPMRCTFTPIALEGAQSDCTESSGSVALFHLICAASAFSLSRMRALPDAKRALERMALEHHSLGITHMRRNIQSNDESQCVSVLASLVMCLYNDAITGPTPYWRLHMRGAVKWVNHFDYQVWQQSESASLIYQMFNCMATYIQSQFLLVDHDESLWDLPFGSPEPYMLDLAFGLPLSLLRGLSSINQIHMARIRSNRGDTGDAMQTFIPNADRLELELYMSVPTKLHSSDKVLDEMVYHNGYIHYYANLIYMKRVLRDASIEAVQSLIEQGLDHIEALQTTATKTFSPFLWPISIIALDAYHTTLQRRSSRCLDVFARRSGLDMWNQLSRLIKELWALRETQGNADMKWHESSLFFANNTFMML